MPQPNPYEAFEPDELEVRDATPVAAAPGQLAAIWTEVQGVLQGYIQREQFETWFRRAELRALDADTATLAVQNGFSRHFIESFYLDVLERALGDVLGAPRRVQLAVDAELTVAPRRVPLEDRAGSASPEGERRTVDRTVDRSGQAPAGASGSESSAPRDVDGHRGNPPPRSAARPSHGSGSSAGRGTGPRPGTVLDGVLHPAPRNASSAAGRNGSDPAPLGGHRGLLSASDVGLNPGYRFDTFVVGPCNRFAHAAAVGVSESPGKTYNPFFIHGNVGLGKTHLMQSLCHAMLERDPEVRILYLSCETFVNHFIGALENGDLHEFRNKYRNVDVLVVDDIHVLANKDRTQEEFFHTFNTLYNAGKQIVLSSDSPPKDIPTLQGRLVSRFKWGLVTEMEPPCYETRMAILKRKSRERGRELPDDVARLLAERIDTNIRELEGAVTKVLGYAALASQPVSADLARECLGELFEKRAGMPSMEDVLRVVTQHFSLRLSDIQSRKRTAAIAYARQVGMFLARRVTRLSLEEIGGYFGGRDHSTVLYAIQKITRMVKTDADCLATVRELQRQLGEPASQA
jgi:chromosomal replication initiator protein